MTRLLTILTLTLATACASAPLAPEVTPVHHTRINPGCRGDGVMIPYYRVLEYSTHKVITTQMQCWEA